MNSLLLSSIHLVGVVLLFVVLLARATTLFKNTDGNQPNQAYRKLFVAVQHGSLTILVVTGVLLLSLKNFEMQSWFYAKAVLFLVLLSSLIKAYKKDDSILLVQRRAGWVLAVVAFVAIYGLVILQPTFS
jgi:uncharacterized membrane protein SirB2